MSCDATLDHRVYKIYNMHQPNFVQQRKASKFPFHRISHKLDEDHTEKVYRKISIGVQCLNREIQRSLNSLNGRQT